MTTIRSPERRTAHVCPCQDCGHPSPPVTSDRHPAHQWVMDSRTEHNRLVGEAAEALSGRPTVPNDTPCRVSLQIYESQEKTLTTVDVKPPVLSGFDVFILSAWQKRQHRRLHAHNKKTRENTGRGSTEIRGFFDCFVVSISNLSFSCLCPSSNAEREVPSGVTSKSPKVVLQDRIYNKTVTVSSAVTSTSCSAISLDTQLPPQLCYCTHTEPQYKNRPRADASGTLAIEQSFLSTEELHPNTNSHSRPRRSAVPWVRSQPPQEEGMCA